MGSELERQSSRLNLVEQKRLERELHLLTKNQRSVAVGFQRSQREMKRRLQTYRERQRELMGETIHGPAMTLEDIMRKHQPRLTSDKPSRHRRMSRARPATAPPSQVDMPIFLDIQKSKVDLRPMTAAVRRREMLRKMEAEVSKPTHGAYRPTTGERLGTADMESRYFVDEELNERSAIHHDLIQWRKRSERANYRDVNGKVMDFCGLEYKDTKSGIKAKWKSVGLVLKFKNLSTENKASSVPKKLRKRQSLGNKLREAWVGDISDDDDSQASEEVVEDEKKSPRTEEPNLDTENAP